MKTNRNKIFIIAEAGVNHNGSLKLAKRMVDAAKASGADAIKFQSFKAENLAVRFAAKANYQRKTTGKKENQFDMLKKLELSAAGCKTLFSYCKKKNIMFLSSPFDNESIDLLNNLGLKIFKVPSGEITNLPYLRKIGKLKKKVILSTGMSDLKEIKQALSVLVRSGTRKKNITILHCNTEYPAPLKDVNLNAMNTIKDAFKVNVGYSDHTLGTEVSIAAAALGATVLEKHFTLDKNMAGPDHKASLTVPELKNMINAVRNVEKALGSNIKKASPSERRNIPAARKSIVADKGIQKGEKLSEKNLAVKRPGTGISPMLWDRLL
ncbi:MAG: N-acetylneuraminate synthase, partial [Candidatus Omnitrophica bacterium]|nr:N-acetylneuraminate synthase [Candidatus Omnitrophota bacterium]